MAGPSSTRQPARPRFFTDVDGDGGGTAAVGATDPGANARAEIVAGLAAPGMRIAPKYFYDPLGSALFTAICQLDEYYPTRTEAAIIGQALPELARLLPAGATLVDLGACDCAKGLRLLQAMPFAQYAAVDISADFLRDALLDVQRALPGLDVLGIGADFTDGLRLPPAVRDADRVFFYPGSSIGNFTPLAATRLLKQWRGLCRADGRLLIGVDLVKDTATLEAAYDDAIGVTAAFNLNVLRHVNRLAGTDFDPRRWRHRAVFDAGASRIEMHLVATEDQRVNWPGGGRDVRAGESIHTENSYKYTVEGFGRVLSSAGWRVTRAWTDDRAWFALILAEPIETR
ncbi:MAG: L-histidine N(alpha)-methyltransferase [Lautropia sp.]